MAADWARCRELSHRIRDDLIHLGLVGDRPDHPDRRQRRSLGRGPDHLPGQRPPPRGRRTRPGPGQRRRPADRGHHPPRHHGPPNARSRPGHRAAPVHRPGLPLHRLPVTSDLAYAVTGHSAQGATVHTGIALVTGSEDRQWLYPAMTRGTDANLAFVFTTPARPADPQPGTRTAPELDRYDRTRRERAGYPAAPLSGAQPGLADQREPIAVLADVLSRDGAELSASAIRQRNLADADHLLPCTPSGPPKPRPPATTATATWSRPRSRPATASRSPTRPAGCSAPCTPPNWPAWTPPRSSAPPSPPATWPDPATSPPSWTPGSGRASTRCSPSRKAPGPDGSPSCPTPTDAPTWPRSPR